MPAIYTDYPWIPPNGPHINIRNPESFPHTLNRVRKNRGYASILDLHRRLNEAAFPLFDRQLILGVGAEALARELVRDAVDYMANYAPRDIRISQKQARLYLELNEAGGSYSLLQMFELTIYGIRVGRHERKSSRYPPVCGRKLGWAEVSLSGR